MSCGLDVVVIFFRVFSFFYSLFILALSFRFRFSLFWDSFFFPCFSKTVVPVVWGVRLSAISRGPGLGRCRGGTGTEGFDGDGGALGEPFCARTLKKGSGQQEATNSDPSGVKDVSFTRHPTGRVARPY